MKKTIIYLLFGFVLSCLSITAQKQVPVYVESSQLIYMDELDSYLYKAAVNFINFKDKEASDAVMKASAFITQAANTRNDINKGELDRVLKHVDKEIVRFGNKLGEQKKAYDTYIIDIIEETP